MTEISNLWKSTIFTVEKTVAESTTVRFPFITRFELDTSITVVHFARLFSLTWVIVFDFNAFFCCWLQFFDASIFIFMSIFSNALANYLVYRHTCKYVFLNIIPRTSVTVKIVQIRMESITSHSIIENFLFCTVSLVAYAATDNSWLLGAYLHILRILLIPFVLAHKISPL